MIFVCCVSGLGGRRRRRRRRRGCTGCSCRRYRHRGGCGGRGRGRGRGRCRSGTGSRGFSGGRGGDGRGRGTMPVFGGDLVRQKKPTAGSDTQSGVVVTRKAGSSCTTGPPAEPRLVPQVAIPATRSRVQHVLRRGSKPPGGSGMNSSERSGAPTWGGGYTQGAHLRMFPQL